MQCSLKERLSFIGGLVPLYTFTYNIYESLQTIGDILHCHHLVKGKVLTLDANSDVIFFPLSFNPFQDFNPEKYRHMADIFGQSYLSCGSPVSIVSHYLSVYTRGEISEPPDPCLPLAIRNYDIRKAYVACPFKGEHVGDVASESKNLVTVEPNT